MASTDAVTVTAPPGQWSGAPLSGLSGLYGNESSDPNQTFDEGVLEAHANTLDPEHGNTGSQGPGELPYGGTSYGQDSRFTGFTPDYSMRGIGGLDQTPSSHANPYPRGIIQQSWDEPDAVARAGAQTALLHGVDQGGPRANGGFNPAGRENPTDYTTDRYGAPNETDQALNVPGQIRGGLSALDTAQGYGQLNSTDEFKRGHSIRRVQHDKMPMDYTNTHGGQDGPFLGRIPIAQARFDGPDSPYFAAGAIDQAQVMMRSGGASDPTPYQPPPDPTIAAGVPGTPSSPWAY
jgi:hypothetical protein